MFNRKTVFILGAGASWHYGYPTGEELVRRVSEKAQTILADYSRIGKHGMPNSYYSEFDAQHFCWQGGSEKMKEVKRRIEQANPLVIDDFFGRNKDIADLGNLLIAMVLHDCDKGAKLRPKKKDLEGKEYEAGDWVRHIVQQLIVDCSTPEDFLNNQVTFVTFNYDLSLERRLNVALKNYKWCSEGGHCDLFFSPGRVYHVYGRLNDFDVSQPSGPNNRYRNEFELANEIDRAFDAARNIRTISPDEKNAEPEIVKAIADAEYLYFLGYGFDRRNNDLLGLGKRSENTPRQFVKFTNFGNHNKVNKQVARSFNIHSVELAGENQLAGSNAAHSYPRYYWEKSIKSVYDALAQDFDWPE